MKLSISWVAFFLVVRVKSQNMTMDIFEPFGRFDGCGLEDYYEPLGGNNMMTWDRAGLHALIKSTHRLSLKFTNRADPGFDDVWHALMDVDAGEVPNTVRLVYQDQDQPNIPYGRYGWIKEHLFPILRGVGLLGPDFTDIHSIRPALPLTDIVRNVKYFGECGVLDRPETCVRPAEGAAADTCACDRVFTPPKSMKGDIARALMYMDIRYDGSELGTRDLRLTDCPFQPERDMAYLSQMLRWHEEDPPDKREELRNQKVCENWQGNRNPFIDHPSLARQIWGNPLALPETGERLIYEACEAIPTLPPTYSPNSCDMITPGDIQIWLLNSDAPDTLGLYTFTEFPEDFELFVTDNPWDGEKFIEQEGTIRFIPPIGGLRAGTAFGYGAEDMPFENRWDEYQGTLSISTEGEPIFVYCIDAAGDQRPLLAFNNGGEYVETGEDSYKETESALPEGLGEDGVVTLPHKDNYYYVGESALPSDQLKVAIRDPTNWDGSDTQRFALTGDGTSGSSGSGSRFHAVFMFGITLALVASAWW